MILKWGGYSFEDNEIWFTTRRQELLGQTGIRIGWKETWTVGGVIKADNVAAITTRIDGMRDALDVPFQDLVFVDNDGNDTAHKIINSETLNGTRVVGGLQFPKPQMWGMGDEYAAYKRTFGFTVEAEVYDPEGNIMFYEETVRLLAPGSRRFAMVVSLQGVPQDQTLAAQTPTIIEQIGRAVGIHTYPNYGAPLYPAQLKDRPFMQEVGTPEKFGTVRNVGFPVSWRYQMEGVGLALVPPTPVGTF